MNNVKLYGIIIIIILHTQNILSQALRLNNIGLQNRNLIFSDQTNDQNESLLFKYNSHNKLDIELDSILVKNGLGVLEKRYKWEYVPTSNGSKIVSSQAQNINDNWMPYVREVRFYDHNGNLLSYSYEMKRDSNNLENFLLINYEYDSSNNMISSESYFWENSEWANRSKYNFSYDNNNNQILSIGKYWYDSFWDFYERISREFDNGGNKLQEIREWWDSNTQEWIFSERHTFTYDSNGNITSNVAERYYNDKWNYYDRFTYSEDRSIYLYQKYKNNQWLNSQQIKFEFDANGRDTSDLWQEWTNDQWINSKYYTWNYNVENTKVIRLFYAWANETWELFDRLTYEYNENGNLISAIYERINDPTGTTVFNVCNQSICYSINGKEVKLFYNTISDVNENKILKENYYLSQNYPNPFNPSTTISYSLSQNGFVQLNVYDVLGREVANLANKKQKKGKYRVDFNASKLSSGIYFYKLKSGNYTETKKMILLR